MEDDATVQDYIQQSRDFLRKARQYLAEDDLHQASEKGWGAASHMAKAVAHANGWEYEKHHQFKRGPQQHPPQDRQRQPT